MPSEQEFASTNALGQRNELQVSGELDVLRPQTVLHMGAGRSIAIPTELLIAGLPEIAPKAGADTAFSSAMEASAGLGLGARQGAELGAGQGAGQREQVIPLTEEQIRVGKRTVTTGTVRLHRDVETFTDSATVELRRIGWEVDRVPVGQAYAERPEVRQEGDTMVYPLVEERLVVAREYFVVEEVRVRQVATTTERTANVELKRDVLTVEREGAVPPTNV